MNYKLPQQAERDFPLYFRFARAWSMLFQGWRGEYFPMKLLKKFGLLNRAGRFPFFDGSILIPLDVPETRHIRNFSLHSGLREINFANVVWRELKDCLLIDCGSGFGQVSMRMLKLCPSISHVIAIDANSRMCKLSEENLKNVTANFNVLNSAVSNFSGNAELFFPDGEHVFGSAYIRENKDGPIRVIRLDDLPEMFQLSVEGRDIAVKLDIEGQELAAIEGAERMIVGANKVCYFVEIHPDVLRRNNQTPEQLLSAISDLRPTKWVLADLPALEIDLSRSFFEHIGGERICDVIGVAV